MTKSVVKTITTQLPRQLLGVGILLKTLLPPIIIGSLLIIVFTLFSAISNSIATTIEHIDGKKQEFEEIISDIENEADRMYGEIIKISEAGETINKEVKKTIEPIRKSVKNIWGRLKSITDKIETTMNKVVDALNFLLPKKFHLKAFNLPTIKIPKLPLPNLEIDIDLNPDLTAIYALKSASLNLQENLLPEYNQLTATLSNLLFATKFIGYLIALWFLLVCISFFMRVGDKIRVGMQLLRGKEVTNALIYF